MRDVRVSTDRNETVDVIYGNVVTSRLEEERIDQRRKRKAEQVLHVTQKSVWSSFVVLPAVSPIPTLSVKGCVPGLSATSVIVLLRDATLYILWSWSDYWSCSSVLTSIIRVTSLVPQNELSYASRMPLTLGLTRWRNKIWCSALHTNLSLLSCSYYALQTPAILPS